MLATILLACGEPSTWGVTGGTGGSSGLLSPMVARGIAAAIVSAGIIVLAAIVAPSRRNDPIPTPVPAGATLSPDGYYWWDGRGWRPVR